jgi:mannose-6-phosphate isomerase-like protein (cupin superfamily)
MNPLLTTLPPSARAVHTKNILSKDGFTCSLITVEPRHEAPQREAGQGDEYILFVVDGEVTVGFEDVNTILSKDEAMLIPQGKEHVIVAQGDAPAKLLRVEVPPRQVVTPQILSFDR